MYLSVSGMLSLARAGGPARMLCISFVIFLAGSSLSPVTMGRIIATVYGGSDGFGRGGSWVGVVGLSLMLGGTIGGSVKCARSSSVYGL